MCIWVVVLPKLGNVWAFVNDLGLYVFEEMSAIEMKNLYLEYTQSIVRLTCMD